MPVVVGKVYIKVTDAQDLWTKHGETGQLVMLLQEGN